MSRENRVELDQFAAIAAEHNSTHQKGLSEPRPVGGRPEKQFVLKRHDRQAVFHDRKKIDNPEKLQRELEKQRKHYEKYMRDFSPEQQSMRDRIYLKKFDWRLEDKQDKKDFSYVSAGQGQWEKVSIPHYDAPINRNTSYYRTEFRLNRKQTSKNLFIHFNAVDYKAHVFINGNYIGSHTGFFAPFEFEFTNVAKTGKNVLVVKVENDIPCMGNTSWDDTGDKYGGDKIYAATGPGYDDPEVGWHHCPPGMGIYQDVYIETRNPIHITDIFVRPLLGEQRAELWLEVNSCLESIDELKVELSLFGRNFRKTVFKNKKVAVFPAAYGSNLYRIGFDIPDARVWGLETPWLYQIQVLLISGGDQLHDTASRHFGMRSFRMDETGRPKGMLYLNGNPIRLRGCNTMGHLQQSVIKSDWDQLWDDILLAKICNMNFFRLTQRPVQSEIYDYCDMLGILTQTDLPMFGVLRHNLFSESVKQAEEMERLVRSHPCNIMVSYINEPSQPDSYKETAHRHLGRKDLERFFAAADNAIKVVNPDRVIKHVDGDYFPPAPVGFPDNHCYCCWYNGHGLDVGKLYRGYWQKVKRGWYYGCGEFGAEGIDFADIMRKYYPKHWLPQSKEEEKIWKPGNQYIPRAQTANFHYMWFEKQHKVEDWVKESQRHQEWATKLMTEAFRRDSRMVSFAIHLFIDAFPSGWMKTVMDFKRNPKPAYFAYRDALTPLMISLRNDRSQYFAGEKVQTEIWICNDLNAVPAGVNLHYQLEMDGKIISAEKEQVEIPLNSSIFAAEVSFDIPATDKRKKLILRAALIDAENKILHSNSIEYSVFPKVTGSKKDCRIAALGNGARKLLSQLGVKALSATKLSDADGILISDYRKFEEKREEIEQAVKNGKLAVLLEVPEGNIEIADTEIDIRSCGMSPVSFVSRDTGHPLVEGFSPYDFRLWYNERAGMITPFLSSNFTGKGFVPILKSGNGQWGQKEWIETMAAAECEYGSGKFRICQLELLDRVNSNCTARIFAERLLGMDRYRDLSYGKSALRR